jgi:hypothetical protein
MWTIPSSRDRTGEAAVSYLTIDGIVGTAARGLRTLIEIAGYSFDVTALAAQYRARRARSRHSRH